MGIRAVTAASKSMAVSSSVLLTSVIPQLITHLCLPIAIGSVYLLVIDQKGDPGLDISADAYNLITGSTLGPSGAPIATADGKGMGGPVAGSYAQVDISLCSVHWTGSCPANYMGTWCQ